MRKLEIDFFDLEGAIESNFPEMHYYLDTETGEVLMVMDEVRRELESLFKDAAPDAKLDDLLRELDLHDWQKEAIKEANRVEEHYGTRCVAMLEPEPSEDFRDMADFAETVQNAKARIALERA